LQRIGYLGDAEPLEQARDPTLAHVSRLQLAPSVEDVFAAGVLAIFDFL
jgi:hypothetical protein